MTLRHPAIVAAVAAFVTVVAAACGHVEVPGNGARTAGSATARGEGVRRIFPRPPGGIVIVQGGDTVWEIAQRFGVSQRALIQRNRLVPPYHLAVGQRLVLPPAQVHVVGRGETLYGISRQYAVDVWQLARLNDIGAPYTIHVGQQLRLPGRDVTAEQRVRGETATAVVVRRPPPPGSREAAVPTPPSVAGGGFAWPVQGRIVSRFGPKVGGLHNDGVNIAAPRGTPVKAAENGVVAYAGSELKGFGNLLLVKHDGGWVSAYAHNDALLVKRGDTVRKGQVIAKVGSSGSVESPQLHFELRKGRRAVDPIGQLGGGRV